MAECDWAIMCDYAFLDVGRKMCLIGAFDRVFAAQVPAQQHQAALAIKIVGDPHEAVKFDVNVLRPQGGLLGKIEGEATLGDSGSAEIQLNIAGLPLPDWGLYSFQIYVDGALSKTTGFTVSPPPPVTKTD